MEIASQVSETQQIWSEFGHRLRSFIARRVESEADADDILQEVFLRIHRHAGSVQQSERLASWLFQITRNAIADYYRAPVRRRELLAGAPADLERTPAHVWSEDDERELASPAVRRELATCLGPMIERLPALYRDALRLVDLEGLPQHEAAARAGLSVSGMKSRVQRGRQALKAVLQECCRVELDAGGRVTDYEPRGSGCAPDANGCPCGG
jgi:RNA polymerase sigma-70 factor (ECF subfamily)